MRKINEFMEWAASHALLREIGGKLYCSPSVVGLEPWKYLYGTSGRLCTKSILDNKYSAYYKGFGWTRDAFNKATAGWVEKGVYVCDCQGLEDAYSGADTNAKGNYANYCSRENRGLISEIARPYVYGEALFCGKSPERINHVGWVIGEIDGEPLIIHERGLSHGCVIERMSKSGKSWTYRGLMDRRYEYTVTAAGSEVDDEPVDAPDERELSLKSPMMRGDDVKQLQCRLSELGYNVGVADGIYGSKTDLAVKAYQAYAARVTLGVVDEATRKLLGL